MASVRHRERVSEKAEGEYTMRKKMKMDVRHTDRHENWKSAEVQLAMEDEWEVRAFAEDSRANLVWPPRCYPCLFCRREFRSAQALGGHMNVHRHDRARMRQSITPPISSITAAPAKSSCISVLSTVSGLQIPFQTATASGLPLLRLCGGVSGHLIPPIPAFPVLHSSTPSTAVLSRPYPAVWHPSLSSIPSFLSHNTAPASDCSVPYGFVLGSGGAFQPYLASDRDASLVDLKLSLECNR